MSRPVFIGYFFLPGRVNGAWDYNSDGLGEWHYRKKLGGEFSAAPILIDRLQGHGAHSTNLLTQVLSGSCQKMGVRLKRPITPASAGFQTVAIFFEDGHVQWIQSRNVTLGSSQSQWQCFYGIRLP